MERFRYPLLTASEIFIQLKHSLGISINSEEDITKPKPESIKDIYLSLISIAEHKNIEELTKPTAQELSMLKYGETQEVIVPTIKIFRYLQKVLLRIGCKDDQFKLADLLTPDFKRTRKFLSAFINYLRFMTEEQELLMDKNEEFVKARITAEEYKKIKDEKERLGQEVQSLKKMQAEQQPLIDKKMAELNEVESEKAKVLEERKKLEEMIIAMNIEVEGYEKAILNINRLAAESENTKKNIEQNIIEDPDKLINSIQDKRERLNELTKSVKNDQNNNKEIQAQLEKMENFNNLVREAAIILDTINISNEKYKELCKSLEVQKQEALTLKKELYQRSLERKTQENEILGLGDKIEKIQKTGEGRLFTIENSLESKKNEKEYVFKQHQELAQELKEKKNILNSLQDQFKNMEEKHTKTINSLKDQHEKIIEKAQTYSKMIFSTLETHEFPCFLKEISSISPYFDDTNE